MLRVDILALPEAYSGKLPKYTLTANVDLALLKPQQEALDCQPAVLRDQVFEGCDLGVAPSVLF